RNWCAYVVTRSVSCVVEDGVESFVKPDYQPCAWGQLQCPRVLAYRTFLRPRYRVSQRTVSELAWRCCQGYSGEDCMEGPAPAPPQPTSHPHPQPGRPTLSGFGNPLSGLGGEGNVRGQDGEHMLVGCPQHDCDSAGAVAGGGDAEKVRRLEEQVRRLSEQVEELRAGQELLPEHPHRAPAAGFEGEQPADAAAPVEVREALSHVQRRLEELETRLRRQENGRESPVLPSGAALRELERRLQETCAACTAGTEGLRRQAAEDRERMRALEKLVGSVDQRNRDAVETVQRHISSLSSRLAPAAPPPPDAELHRRLAELERRIE
ncbi:EMIL1 protein, partial [Indicator maculatus]|nr:EMIL1 protein [Indicator maculatus]